MMRLTVQEAGFLLDRSSKVVNRAIDRDKVAALKTVTGLRLLDFAAVRYLCLATWHEKTFTPAGRRQLYTAMKALPPHVHQVELDGMVLELGKIDRALQEKVERLDAVRSHIVAEPGAEPRLRGSDLPVHLVASLTRGQTVEEIVEDFPSLSAEAVRAAADYALAYPKTGRPYPERSMKRLIAEAAGAGAFDPLPVDQDDNDAKPTGLT